MAPETLSIRVASRLSAPARIALLLVATCAWSGLAHGLDCACEVATGACIECCGSQTSGSKHCVKPHVIIVPPSDKEESSQDDKAMRFPPAYEPKSSSPAKELPIQVPVDAKGVGQDRQETDYKTGGNKEDKQGKIKDPGKSVITDKAPENPGKAGK